MTAAALLFLGLVHCSVNETGYLTKHGSITPADGGVISLRDGTELSVPSGALIEPTTVTVSRSTKRVPAEFGDLAASPLYEFGPANLSFATPATIRLPVDAADGTPAIFWLNADGTTYAELPTTLVDGRAVAQVDRLAAAAFVIVRPNNVGPGPTDDGAGGSGGMSTSPHTINLVLENAGASPIYVVSKEYAPLGPGDTWVDILNVNELAGQTCGVCFCSNVHNGDCAVCLGPPSMPPVYVSVAPGAKLERQWDATNWVMDKVDDTQCLQDVPAPAGQYTARFCWSTTGAGNPLTDPPADATCVDHVFDSTTATEVKHTVN